MVFFFADEPSTGDLAHPRSATRGHLGPHRHTQPTFETGPSAPRGPAGRRPAGTCWLGCCSAGCAGGGWNRPGPTASPPTGAATATPAPPAPTPPGRRTFTSAKTPSCPVSPPWPSSSRAAATSRTAERRAVRSMTMRRSRRPPRLRTRSSNSGQPASASSTTQLPRPCERMSTTPSPSASADTLHYVQ